jgi:hypothetical protein
MELPTVPVNRFGFTILEQAPVLNNVLRGFKTLQVAVN